MAELAVDQELEQLRALVKKQKEDLFQLQSVLNHLPGSIYWKNKEGVYLGRNRFSTESMERLGFEYRPKEYDLLGKTDYDLFAKETADQFRKHDYEVMTTGKETSMEEYCRLPDGKQYAQLSTKRPMYDSEGRLIGVIGNTVDISYLKQIEEVLLEAKNKAEQAGRVKSQFIRNMEHDIRTPFNGIWGIANFLLQLETDKQKREYLLDIVHCSKELLDYCNGILDFSRINLDTLPVAIVRFDLQHLVDSVIKMETPAAKYKHLQLLLEYADDVPKEVVGDQYRLLRILINLVSNAVKFTSQGTVSLKVFVESRSEKNVMICFVIADTGIGIPEDKRDYIYDAFSRVESAPKNPYKGIGLGLPIVKQFVEEMQGKIHVTSEVGKGSVFTCVIPFSF